MDYLFAVILFAVSSSVTLGPNNIMVMSSGLNFGIKRSLPLLVGICIGFTVMLLLVGVGFSQLFEYFPNLHLIINCVGVSYLLYLAYLIARSSSSEQDASHKQPLSFLNGALFQWVNGKAWVVATGAIAAFTHADADFLSQNLMIASTFFIVSFPCVGVWLLFGSLLKSVLNGEQCRKWFNGVMSGLLVLSVVPVMGEIITSLN